MPAQIIKGVLTYLQTQLNANIWEGEVPRFDTQGNPIEPGMAGLESPSVWPVITGKMKPEAFTRTWTFESPYDDLGNFDLEIFGTGRQEVEQLMNQIEPLLNSESAWRNDILANQGPAQNPYYIIQMLLTNWSCVHEENVRLADGQLSYRGNMTYLTQIHGTVAID